MSKYIGKRTFILVSLFFVACSKVDVYSTNYATKKTTNRTNNNKGNNSDANFKYNDNKDFDIEKSFVDFKKLKNMPFYTEHWKKSTELF